MWKAERHDVAEQLAQKGVRPAVGAKRLQRGRGEAHCCPRHNGPTLPRQPPNACVVLLLLLPAAEGAPQQAGVPAGRPLLLAPRVCHLAGLGPVRLCGEVNRWVLWLGGAWV